MDPDYGPLTRGFNDMTKSVGATEVQMREFEEIVKRLTALQADVDRINAFSKQQYVIEEMEP